MKSNADTAERTIRTMKLIDLPAHDSQFVEPPPAVDDGVESSLSGIMIARLRSIPLAQICSEAL